MQSLFSNLIGGTKERFKSCLQAVLFQIAIGFFALIALGFLTASGFMCLLDRFSGAEAALIVGAVYLVLTLLLASVYAANRTPKVNPVAAPSPVKDIQDDVSSLLDDIATNGFKPSQLALLSTLPGLKNIKPIHLAALGLLAGFISGRKIKP